MAFSTACGEYLITDEIDLDPAGDDLRRLHVCLVDGFGDMHFGRWKQLAPYAVAERRRCGIHTLVARLKGRVGGGTIVGTATVIVEQKLTRRICLAGHVEEVAVAKDMRRKGVGVELVRGAILLCRQQGCYKVTLDCVEDLVPFYERCGMQRAGIQMRIDL